jgi:hypothetical protein
VTPLLPPTTTSFCPAKTCGGVHPSPLLSSVMPPVIQFQFVVMRPPHYGLVRRRRTSYLVGPSLAGADPPHTVETGSAIVLPGPVLD